MLTQLETFARRLRQARLKEKLSMEMLSNLMGGLVSKQAISKYESAKMMPSSAVLISFSKALKEDLDYFYRPFNFDIHEMEISFRKKASVGKRDIEALKIQIQNDVENYLEIEEILGLEKESLDWHCEKELSSADDMVKEAKKIREQWNLGIDPISNVQEMLEANGIKVIITSGPEGFDGVSGMVNKEKPIMVLNDNVTMSERCRFTALHETAHLLFNNNMSKVLTPKEQERLCDAFASEMLLPGEILENMFKGKAKISLNELSFLQESYGISIDAIMYKLKQMGYITEKRYKSFYIRKNKNAQLKEQVERSRFPEKRVSRFEVMVYSALAQQLITTSKAASMMGKSVQTVRDNVNVI